MTKVKLQIEIQKILNVISKDIYDSPYALLRENVQNAYDAILMRLQKDELFETPQITIQISDKEVVISDNGIGMSEYTIENNYWKAGASGKNNNEARLAGVVGTFGIGAMANFGICSQLEVKSRAFGTYTTYKSKAIKESLSVTDDCISLNTAEDNMVDYGTEVRATLESGINLTVEGALDYLSPYVQYLSFPVLLNNEIISQKEYKKTSSNENNITNNVAIQSGEISFELFITVNNFTDGKVAVLANNFTIRGEQIKGEVFLEQGNNYIFGLRNNFGLAPIPINTIFNFGGIVNLSFLVPTAGREALSRESIEYVSKITSIIEQYVAECISKLDIADSNRDFLMYIHKNRRFDLAGKIKIQMQPGDDRITFDNVENEINGKKVYYYIGVDNQIISQYANENSYLLLLSRENPRRNIQQNLLNIKKIDPISDNPRVLKEYLYSELSTAESALTFRLSSILKEDYLLHDAKVIFAEISHNVPNMVTNKSNIIHVYLSKQSGNIHQVLKIYKEEFRLFDGFVKDYVRNYLYPKISPYVPSSTKQGADALFKILQKNKELYTIEYDEFGEIENLMQDYVAGKISINEVFKISKKTQTIQTQTVSTGQIGTIEMEIPNVTNSVIDADNDIVHNNTLPSPPIMLESNETKRKILKTDIKYQHLNNNRFFISLSDRLFERERDFFFQPHSTKVIWGMHKIVYIFTHASNNLSLYYDIELNQKLDDNNTGGRSIPTTTIITKNRIFVPIIPEMMSYFDIKEGKLKFYVRYDILSQFNDLEQNK